MTYETPSHIEGLSIVLKWLTQHNRQCRTCIEGCLDCLAETRHQRYLDVSFEGILTENGHWRWMCNECRKALDAEAGENLDAISDMLNKSLKRPSLRFAAFKARMVQS